MHPRSLEWRHIAVRVGAFFLLLGVAGWPWPPVRRAFASAYCATAGAVLARASFASGTGHARLFPAPATFAGRPGENISSDAVAELSLDGQPGHPRLGINLRRDAFLPLLILVGAIAVAPLRVRSKALCWLVGVPVVLGGSLAALATLISWVFAGGLGPPNNMKSSTLDLAVRLLIAPPGNRFIAPLVLAALLIVGRLRREQRPE